VLAEAVRRRLESKLVPGSFCHFHLVGGFEEAAVAPHSRPVRTSVGDAVDLTYQIVWDEDRATVAVKLGLVVLRVFKTRKQAEYGIWWHLTGDTASGTKANATPSHKGSS
jgi:hypothetical protein